MKPASTTDREFRQPRPEGQPPRRESARVNRLQSIFEHHSERRVHKLSHYFEIYDRHFSRYCEKSPTVLEIGVSQGGSLEIWQEYFGPGVKIFGVDINPECAQFASDDVTIFIGDQADRDFLLDIADRIPPLDILIDDGGHTAEQQKATFEVLFDKVKADGIYLVEDLITSYWREYGGGYRRPGSFVEYSKNFIDFLHAWDARPMSPLQVNDITRSVFGLHYYNSMLVVEKRAMKPPDHVRRGADVFKMEVPLLTRILVKLRLKPAVY